MQQYYLKSSTLTLLTVGHVDSHCPFNCLLVEGVTLSSSILDTFIQGKRQDSSSPWVADDGRPLPYLPSEVTGDAASTSLVFYATKSTFQYYAAKPNFLSNTIVCEIWTQ